jgi:hypothetical protein
MAGRIPRCSATNIPKRAASKQQYFVVGKLKSSLIDELQEVPGLTLQLTAQRLERTETDSPRLIRFKNREVCQRDADTPCKVGERYTAFLHHCFEV